MITNDNKGTYLVKNGQKHDNVIYEWPLSVPWFSSDFPYLRKSSHNSASTAQNGANSIPKIDCTNILVGLVFKIDFDKVEKSGRKKAKLSRGILYGHFFMDI